MDGTAASKVTNRPELLVNPEEGWTSSEDVPLETSGNAAPEFAPGATGPTVAEGARSDTMGYEDVTPADPRLGMNPQGGWDVEKTKRMFPEMFVDPEDWLDPAEQAKKEAGMPFDSTKRFKSDPNWTPSGVRGGQPLPDELRMDRRGFEQQVFQQIGFNPFSLDPYDAVRKSDSQLQDLFDHVFQGKVQYSDLPKLDKNQRAHWDDVVKEHHARAYQEAKSRKQTGMDTYKNMMSMFDIEQKQKTADFSRSEKERAKAEAKASGKPQMRALFNDQGIQTLHVVYPDSRVIDTGKRTGIKTLEDQEPANIKQLRAFVKQYSPPEMTKELSIMLGMMSATNPEKAAQMAELLVPKSNIPEEMRPKVAAAQKALMQYDVQQIERVMGQMAGGQTPEGQPGAQTAQPQQKAAGYVEGLGTTPERAIGMIVSRLQQAGGFDKNREGAGQAIAAFNKALAGNPKQMEYLNKLARALGVPVDSLNEFIGKTAKH